MEQYELYHHGTKGMKWGVRKKSKTGSKGRVNGVVVDKNGKKSSKRNEKSANKKLKTALKIGGVTTTGLGFAGLVGGAATGNPILAFASMGSIVGGNVITLYGSSSINSSDTKRYAASGRNNLAIQEAVKANNRGASLGVSGGTNPFMFG